MQVQFNFEQMRVIGEGLMADGYAILEDAGEGYEGEFLVIDIVLAGDVSLPNPQSNRPLSFEAEVSRFIRKIIEDDKTDMGRAAALEWADACEGMIPEYRSKVYSTLDHRTQGLAVGGVL